MWLLDCCHRIEIGQPALVVAYQFMPKGTKVESLFQKLKKSGHTVESAVKIAQSATGLALATGKPPKGKRASNKTKKHNS
jgi:hypothetical protein